MPVVTEFPLLKLHFFLLARDNCFFTQFGIHPSQAPSPWQGQEGHFQTYFTSPSTKGCYHCWQQRAAGCWEKQPGLDSGRRHGNTGTSLHHPQTPPLAFWGMGRLTGLPSSSSSYIKAKSQPLGQT